MFFHIFSLTLSSVCLSLTFLWNFRHSLCLIVGPDWLAALLQFNTEGWGGWNRTWFYFLAAGSNACENSWDFHGRAASGPFNLQMSALGLTTRRNAHMLFTLENNGQVVVVMTGVYPPFVIQCVTHNFGLCLSSPYTCSTPATSSLMEHWEFLSTNYGAQH